MNPRPTLTDGSEEVQARLGPQETTGSIENQVLQSGQLFWTNNKKLNETFVYVLENLPVCHIPKQPQNSLHVWLVKI